MNRYINIFLEIRDYKRLCWNTDFDGYEVGYPERCVIGYYTYGELNLYIDTESNEVVEMWFDEEEC